MCYTLGMNRQTTLTAEDLLGEIVRLEKTLVELKAKVISYLPPEYGSEQWWKMMDKVAEESIRAGKGKKFNSYKEAIGYLKG